MSYGKTQLIPLDGSPPRILVGRPIGAATGYSEYSAALRRHSGRWTEAELDRFLSAPQTYSPGTTMGFPGISDADTRAAVISHLKTLSR